jgi:hypothetical protein
MKIEYSDYKCPDTASAVVGGKIVAFDETAVAALAANAMMLAVGVGSSDVEEPELVSC